MAFSAAFLVFTLFYVSVVASGPVELFLSTEDGSLAIDFDSNLDRIQPDYPIKILIHGWTETCNTSEYIQMAEEYSKKGNYNVIRADYSSISQLDFLRAFLKVESVGEYIGRFVTMLYEDHNVSLANVHLIGHSLGGQVCGYAGRTVFRLTGSKLGRITALDPARPAYESNFVPSSAKLTRKNAEMVDIIHTDAGELGYEHPAGSLDFYPNGGRKLQPECKHKYEIINKLPPLQLIWNKYLFSDDFCSHIKSKEYFVKSINGHYLATKCKSWKLFVSGGCECNEQTYFGEDASPTAEGVYYLRIQDE